MFHSSMWPSEEPRGTGWRMVLEVVMVLPGSRCLPSPPAHGPEQLGGPARPARDQVGQVQLWAQGDGGHGRREPWPLGPTGALGC